MSSSIEEAFEQSPLMQELYELVSAGDLPESEAKRHHLVPRFLLSRFVDSGQERQRIAQLDVHTGTNHWVDPAEAASRMRFYRLTDDDGTVHQRVEFLLSRIEDHAAKALRRMCEAPTELSPADRATLSVFFALLESRTQSGLERIVAVLQQGMEAFVAGKLADEETFAQDVAQFMESADPESVNRQRQYMIDAIKEGRINLKNPKEVAISMLLRSALDTAGIVYQMHWGLLSSVHPEFITSDRGLAMYDPTPAYPWTGSGLLTSPNAQTTVPLDPQRCLLLVPGRTAPTGTAVDVVEVGRAETDDVNLRTYGFASSYIFASDQETAKRIRTEAKRHPGRVTKAKPFRQVILIDAEEGDDRLAKEHRKLGWPEQFVFQGHPHDYVVLDPNDNPVERSIDLSEIGRQRATRRLGTSDLEATTIALPPHQVTPITRR